MKLFIILTLALAVQGDHHVQNVAVDNTAETLFNTGADAVNTNIVPQVPSNINTQQAVVATAPQAETRHTTSPVYRPLVMYRSDDYYNQQQALPAHNQYNQFPIVIPVRNQAAVRFIPISGGVSGNLGPIGGTFGGALFQPNTLFNVGGQFGVSNSYLNYGNRPTYEQYYNPSVIYGRNEPIFYQMVYPQHQLVYPQHQIAAPQIPTAPTQRSLAPVYSGHPVYSRTFHNKPFYTTLA